MRPRVPSLTPASALLSSLLFSAAAMAAAPERTIIFTNSTRMWVSVIASSQNFLAGQRIRDAHKETLTAAPPATFKLSGAAGDADYFSWYDLQRREFDNTAELIRLLKNGGFDYFAHARRPEDEDTFLFGPNVIETLETKRQIMRARWLDAQSYLVPPNR